MDSAAHRVDAGDSPLARRKMCGTGNGVQSTVDAGEAKKVIRENRSE